MSIRICAAAAALCAASTAHAVAVPIADSSIIDRATLLTGLQPLNLSDQVYGPQLSGPDSNTFSTTYIGGGGNYSGTLTVEIFGNVGQSGAALNDVVLIYTFAGDDAFNGAEGFEFGIDSQFELDADDLLGATQGTIVGDTSAGQVSPDVTYFENAGANDTWFFDYNAEPDNLGGPDGDEVVSWYVRAGGDVKLNFVDVTITNFGTVTVDMLALVVDPTQPDLNIPAPGAIALLAGAGVVGIRRRR